MLQQTQVSRVLTKYPEFLRTFPSLRDLAQAPQQRVVRHWRGMGYNNRAVRLHRLSVLVVRNFGGRLPRQEESLRALPGIGLYTARAVRVFAFGMAEAAIDINGQRVLSRLFGRMPTTSELLSEKEAIRIAYEVLPRRSAYAWNQAIMDLGATVCTARIPRCDVCPLARACASRRGIRRTRRPAVARGPSLAGIPTRIYRGRIVELLRHARRPVRLEQVGRSIYGEFSRQHHDWLEQLVQALARDGLVTVTGNGRIASRRVALA
jgi:A/G-specific adenine glycosylase